MGVVLHESSHTSQTSQRTAGLITVNDTKFSHTDNEELLVAPMSGVKGQALAGTLRGLEDSLPLLYV